MKMLVLLITAILLITSGTADEITEDGCDLTKKYPCNSTHFINPVWICDGENDCADGRDEQNCDSRYCEGEYIYRCSNGKYIPKDEVCDSYSQCPDNEDEIGCTEMEYKGHLCKSERRCVPNWWYRCNGKKDCEDNSDEIDCHLYECNTEFFISCGNFTCIGKEHICDGESDCSDSYDEENCDEIVKCEADQLKCNHKCIPNEEICDGITDCINGEDETDCNLCDTATHFKCQSSECILKYQLCDGNDDCTDKSDENNCDQEEDSELEERFKVLAGKVLAIVK